MWRIVKENPETQATIAKAGGAETLVLLLRDATRRPATPQAKAYALWSLSLCIDASNYEQVVDAGGVRPLVLTLGGKDITAKEQAACALSKLAVHHDDARAEIARAGGVEPLIALLDGTEAGGSDASQQHAAAALAELAHIAGVKDAIGRAGGIAPLVSLLWSNPDAPPSAVVSKRHAAAALARLSTESGSEEQLKSGKGSTGAAAAVEAARAAKTPEEVWGDGDDDESTRSMPAGRSHFRRRPTLLPSRPTPALALQIADAGAIAPLVKLLTSAVNAIGRGETSAEAQAEAAGALWALADHASNRLSITESGGIGPLVSLLGCDNSHARMHAEGALVRLSIETSNRVLIIKQLVSMLTNDGSTCAAAKSALAHPATRPFLDRQKQFHFMK